MNQKNEEKIPLETKDIAKRLMWYGIIHLLGCCLYWLPIEGIQETRAYPFLKYLIAIGPFLLGAEIYFKPWKKNI